MSKGLVCMIAYTNYVIDARVRREAETLASQGYDVRCLTTRNGSASKTFNLEGVEVRELSVARYRGKSFLAYIGSYVSFLVVASAACARLLFEERLDVVHVHNLPDFLVFAGLLPRLRGSKVVLDVHDSVPETFATKFSGRSWLMKALCLEERVSALVAHRVICVNHPQREALVARGIPCTKTFVSMNVPDPRIFGSSSIGRRQGDVASGFNLVYHGTMAERLGVDLLIRAVASCGPYSGPSAAPLGPRRRPCLASRRLPASCASRTRSSSSRRAFRCTSCPRISRQWISVSSATGAARRAI